MNWYPNSVINKQEWSERVGVEGGIEIDKIFRVCEIIKFYIGKAERGKKIK